MINNLDRMKPFLLTLFLFGTVLVSAQSLQRPSIFITTEERADVLNKIEKYSWAKTVQSGLKKRVDTKVSAHKTNPAQTINSIIALAADDNLSEAEVGSANTAHYNTLTDAAFASMLYYITENEDYAQFAADIIWHYFQSLAPRTPEKTAICGYYFFDPRSTYPNLAVAYDFVYNFLNKPGTMVYDKAAGKRIAYNNTTAQKAMKNVAGNALLESGGVDNKYGQLVSNHPVLTAPGTLAAILCVDDDTERERLFNVFWKTGTKRQNSFTKTIMPMFGEQGIWPESTSYGFMPNIQLILNMVDRYKPELNVAATYLNALEGVFLFENLRHPNRSFVRYGDSKRYNDNTLSSYSYVLTIAKRKGYADMQEKAETAMAQYFNANGGRNTELATSSFDSYSYLDLFWGEELPTGSFKEFEYKPTVIIKHAGVALQRNYTETNNKEFGLCGIIGGAHYVHSHCTGISMELYGSGDIMAANGGMPPAVADRKLPEHTNYFRLYAGNNTVIVNGTSHGTQSGAWSSNSYLWQNTTINVASEPAHLEDPISTNFSFATQFLDDNVNNCDQQRTLSTIRTSPTTAYYFDMFRSKSNVTNNFHDYIYHNIGDATSLKDTNNVELQLSATTRYQNNIGDAVKSPGWYLFENTQASASTDQAVNIRFHLQSRGRYMHMKTPGGTSYEYTKAIGPATREAQYGYVNKKTQIVAVRKQGEAWNNPFTFVFEPTTSATGSVISVEQLKKDNKVVGAIVTSMVAGKEIHDYIICNDKTDSIALPEHNIWFNGRFGIVRKFMLTADTADVTLYIGNGNSLKYGTLNVWGDEEDKNIKTYNGIKLADYINPDFDNDGTLNIDDPHPFEAFVANDTILIFDDSTSKINLLENDDFIAGNGITLSDAGTGSATGIISFDASTGELFYEPSASETGSTVTVDYLVCNEAVTPSVCGTATAVISVVSAYDSDNDGIPDFEDADDDNDGTLDEVDPNPFEAVVVNDTLSVNEGTLAIINLLQNDDFIAGNEIVVSDLKTGSATGTINIDSNTGELNYTPAENEGGTTVTVNYSVCNLAVEPAVCGTGTVTINVLKTTNLDRYNIDQGFLNIYPNPSKSVVNIEMLKKGNKFISVYDLQGQVVWQINTNLNRIRLLKGSDLMPGVYLIVVSGELNASRKIIIQ